MSDDEKNLMYKCLKNLVKTNLKMYCFPENSILHEKPAETMIRHLKKSEGQLLMKIRDEENKKIDLNITKKYINISGPLINFTDKSTG